MTGRAQGRLSVIIVGGGASGVLLAIHLLRDKDADLRVTLIEKRPDLGRGVAYSTQNPGHLLNVAPKNMSAFPDDPEHFWRWLIARGEIDGSDPFTFVPRRVYGDYLNDIVAGIEAEETGHGRLHVVREECVSITDTSAGVEAGLANGTSLMGHFAVLAVGHDDQTPVPPVAANGPERDLPILILGTGLSMVDAYLSLREEGHRGPVIAMSRRGLLPHAHRQVTPFRIDAADVPFGTDLTYFTAWFRDFAATTEHEHGDWRMAVDALRPFNQTIWQNWAPKTRRRFLEHLRPWWDIHRHRMPPAAHAHLAEAIFAGHVKVIAGKIQDTEHEATSTLVTFRRRGATETETIRVARIYDCKGISRDWTRCSSALVRGLLDRRQARTDPLHIGLDVTAQCALIDGDGTPSDRLFAIGPLSRGTFFEIEAVPDIRVQCANLAHRLFGVEAVAAMKRRR
jgi:uncharacterized NAD(P)/FAD-binding protein YdhS